MDHPTLHTRCCKSTQSRPAEVASDIHAIISGKDLKMFSEAGFDMDKIHLKRNASVAQLLVRRRCCRDSAYSVFSPPKIVMKMLSSTSTPLFRLLAP